MERIINDCLFQLSIIHTGYSNPRYPTNLDDPIITGKSKFSLLNDSSPFTEEQIIKPSLYSHPSTLHPFSKIKPLETGHIQYKPTVYKELIAIDQNATDPCRKNFNLSDIEALIAQLKSNMNTLDSGGKEKVAMILKLEDDATKQKLAEMKQRIEYFLKLKESIVNKKVDDPNIVLQEVEYIPTFTSESIPLKHHVELLNQNIQAIQIAENEKLSKDSSMENLHTMPLSAYAKETGDSNLLKEFENLNNNPKVSIPVIGDATIGSNHVPITSRHI